MVAKISFIFLRPSGYCEIVVLCDNHFLPNAQFNSFQVLFDDSFYDCILNKEQYKSKG